MVALHHRRLEAIVCWRQEDLTDALEQSHAGLRCIVAAGGDGTFNYVLNRRPEAPLGVLPLGNENLVAKHFGFPKGADKLADMIAACHCQWIDVGQAGDHRFALMVSAGYDADVVHRVHRNREGHVGKETYAWEMLQAARGFSFPSMQVEIVETGEVLCGSMVFVFNLPLYSLGLPIALHAVPSDGWLDLYVFDRPGIGMLLRYFAAVATRRHERRPDVHYRRVRQVKIWSDQPVPVQIDGDPAGYLPVTVEIVPQAVRILSPIG